MPTTILTPYLTQAFLGNNGQPLSNGQLFSYQAGTSTPLATYTDNTGTVSNSNPVILNARGEAAVWIPPNVAYKFVLEDAGGNIIWTRDQVQNQLAMSASFYGGVDSGAVNAYVLSGVTGITAYTDGIVVYFYPANTNTGASTLNVNGISVVAIQNLNGTALIAGQIQTNQMAAVIVKGGVFQLLMTGVNPLVLPKAQMVSGSVIQDSAGAQWPVGFLNVPQNIQNANYTTVLADAAKQLYHTDGNAYTWTIAANASVAYPIGTMLTFVNDASAAVNITVAINSDTMLWTPSGATGSRTVAQFGRAVAMKVTATRWWISGTGIT